MHPGLTEGLVVYPDSSRLREVVERLIKALENNEECYLLLYKCYIYVSGTFVIFRLK